MAEYTNYTRMFHGRKIQITSSAQLESFETIHLKRYINKLKEDVEEYTRSIKKKLTGVEESCRPKNLLVNGQSVDGLIEALSKQLDVLRADYEELLEQTERELKKYEELKQESYQAYLKYKEETSLLNQVFKRDI